MEERCLIRLKVNINLMTNMKHIHVLSFFCTMFLAVSVSPETCNTRECLEVSQRIASWVNFDADPCDDFYLYACGKFPESVPLVGKQAHVDTSVLMEANIEKRLAVVLDNDNIRNHGSNVVKKVKQLYDACLGKKNQVLEEKVKKLVFLSLVRKQQHLKKIEKNETLIPLESVLHPTWESVLAMNKREQCRRSVAVKYDYVMTRLYLDQFFNLKETAAARRLVGNIHEALINNFYLPWTDPKAQQKVLDKLKNLTRKIGYPDWIVNDKELDAEYGVKSELRESFESFLSETLFEIQGRVLDGRHKSWIMPVLVVNAGYSSKTEEITIPAGILQGPVFNRNVPSSLNYGGSHSVAGHEISHGMDTWLSDSTAKTEWESHKKCISKQLTSIKEPQTRTKYSWFGPLLMKQMQADIGGVNASWEAYKELADNDKLPAPADRFTSDQLFFISGAHAWCHHSTHDYIQHQMHKPLRSPTNYHRATIPVMNSPYFAKAFNCPAGSRMNPVNKCTSW